MNTCRNLGLALNYTHTVVLHLITFERPFQMVSLKNYNLNANEDFVMFLTSKLIICCIDGITMGMKSQSITYLLSGRAHIYWTLDLEGEMHSIWIFVDTRSSRMQGLLFFIFLFNFLSWAGRPTILVEIIKFQNVYGDCLGPYPPSPESS